MSILDQVFLNNRVQDWLSALLVFALAYIGFSVLAKILIRRLSQLPEEKDTMVDDFIEDLLRRTKAIFVLVLALYLGSLALELPETVDDFLGTTAIVALILQFAFWGLATIDYLVQRRIKADPEVAAEQATTMSAVKLVAKIALWGIVVLLILENITGIEMNTLLASLGIGGIAVALAVQNILGDLFSSVSIALDKPFIIGDSISVDNLSGTIEYIGLKSTRVRSIDGEQMIFSNSDLLSSRIRNFERMEQRRVVFTLGVTYQTPNGKLVAIPEMLEAIIAAQEHATFDRAHFTAYGDSALLFECAYTIVTPDYTTFADTRHAINLEIHKRFEGAGIEFAYPTRTVFLEKPVG